MEHAEIKELSAKGIGAYLHKMSMAKYIIGNTCSKCSCLSLAPMKIFRHYRRFTERREGISDICYHRVSIRHRLHVLLLTVDW